ncbi:MAG: NAD(P)H-dependent glycerol-3-phosphate dehydrogenase [Peptoanaerobacter stomatis]|uniref:NAD(P)H-dependent glycerol-3-phosphate dehydrogenase n=1 Tax=Peptoanaerobacter stomatis TaxID=796937 RepID=UPI003F9FA9FD
MKVSVIGAGSWGSSLALVLKENNQDVCLYMRRKEQLDEFINNNTNSKYLKDIVFPKGIKYTNDLEFAIKFADIIILSVTAQSTRQYIELLKPYLKPEQIVVNVSKGIETGTNLRISQIYDEIIGKNNFVVLSGPSHAEEVSKKMPTTIVSSSKDLNMAKKVQHIFSNDYFRVYTNVDIIGVELGGALKNIIALGSGVCDAIGYGDNTKAAIITRGIHEISRLGIKLGANPTTFSGLSGIGDLIVTCTSKHSRNKRAGLYIAQGLNREQVQEKVGMIVEGISTTLAGYTLSVEHNVSMPITKTIYDVIYNGRDIKQGIKDLMSRDKKSEILSEEIFIL